MDNANFPAFPADSHTQNYGGLTKREYFAGLAMQGILSNSALFMGAAPEDLADKSVKCADALIKQLNENQ